MFLAEIGDKTFILTMISYHELGGCITFITAYVTLCAMHILAATLGWGVSYVIPRFWTKLICTVIFLLVAIGMFIMACYGRNEDEVNVALGKKGHSVTVTTKTKVEVNKPETEENQAEGGSSDDESGSGDDDSDGEGSGDSDESSDNKDKDSGDDDSDSAENSSESDESVHAEHLSKKDEVDHSQQVIFRA